MSPVGKICTGFLISSVFVFVCVKTQDSPTCQTAGGFCWSLTSQCPGGFRGEVSEPYTCSQVGTQCCVMVAGCEESGGFCWSLNSQCPAGFATNQSLSNYKGCFRNDRQCCMKNESDTPKTDPKSRETCGLGSLGFRVLNGQQTGMCDWPFVVSIRGRDSDAAPLSYSNSKHACAGVLIDTQWVLTSPICVLSAGVSVAEVSSRLLVVAGEHNITVLDLDPVTRAPMEKVMEVTDVYFEPRYPFRHQVQTIAFLNDAKIINNHGVALLRLKSPVSGQCVGVACLPTAEEAANDCLKHKECVILGWGYTRANFQGIDDTLRKGSTRLTSRNGCHFLSDRLNVTDFRPDGSICQSPRDINTDSCLGDEGGPVLCAEGRNWVVRGVLPFNLCREGNYQLWVTEVAGYLAWIHQVMGS